MHRGKLYSHLNFFQGMYFVSCVLLMRMNMLPEYRLFSYLKYTNLKMFMLK